MADRPYWATPANRPSSAKLLDELDHMGETRARRLERAATRRPDQVNDGARRDRLGDLVGLGLAILGAAVAVAVILAALLVEVTP